MIAALLLSTLTASPMVLDEPDVAREVTCRRAELPPKIDGKLDDPAWSRAELIDKFPAFWSGTKSGTGTKARLLWDDEGLYFSSEMSDKEVKAFGKKRNDTLWFGDVFELFFKPSPDSPKYYEFQANPRSVILELQIPGQGFDFDALAAKPPLGMRATAVVSGTLDKPGDEDQGWTIEGFIPWSVFAPTGGTPRPGDAWTFALCRYDYGAEGTKPVLMSSAPLREPNFHKTEDYARLVFAGPPKK